ncbi:CPBP family intramembrane glutamic endopeptidase [Plantibacter sp. Mn2098]|uniref:CPBP family intramembrane glutamic endopeptidase n=1 Tax=Plantibacter sp. Mn2098 TaxID=3395266 RepID=UPI003BDA5E2E
MSDAAAPVTIQTPAHHSEPALTYDQGLRATPSWWRGAVAIIALIAMFFTMSFIFGAIAIGIDLATGEYTIEQLASGVTTLTPALMAGNNLALASLLPIAMLLQWALFNVRPRWLTSVQGTFRWRWLGRLALIIVPVWVIYVAITVLLPGDASPVTMSGTVIAMLIIVIVTTPLQSAGEEFGARGLIQRSVGSWFRSPIAAFVVSTVVSAGLFALAHAAADPWLIAYYLVFGASMSLAARGTGGLEAPVLIHATNNVLLLIPTALMSQTDQIFNRGAGVGSAWMLIPMALCIAAALVSTWWGRRNGVVSRAALPPQPVRAVRTAPPMPEDVRPVD